MARTNMDLFIASPLELARSCRVMIGGLATLTECLLVLHARRRWLAVIGRAASPSETARVNIVAQVREEVKWPKINRLKIDLESRVGRHLRTSAGWTDGCVAPPCVATSSARSVPTETGQLWTAPPWQELSELLQHWSGAVMCPACFVRRW